LHDDVIDSATQRRGRPSSNIVFGNKCSVLCGDYLFACAFGGMTRAQSPRALDILSNAAKIIVEGELMQLALRGTVPSQDNYLAMIDCKTAALFAAAAESGVAVADGSTAQQQAAHNFGMAYGRAFQIIDDWLDYTGHDAVLGKATGSDLAEGKITLPALYAYAAATTDAEREFWQDAAANGSNNLAQAVRYLQHHNVAQLVAANVTQHTQTALQALASFVPSAVQNILQQLIVQGTQRTW
jgi:octaprenyl-diphosphate synthase